MKESKKVIKCKREKVTIEWKCQYNKDANGNICSARLIYIHFYTMQAYIL